MTTRKVIAWKNIPSRPPYGLTCVAYLMLDRFHAAQWVWGATGVFVLLIWIICIFGMCTEDSIDVFQESERETASAKWRPYR